MSQIAMQVTTALMVGLLSITVFAPSVPAHITKGDNSPNVAQVLRGHTLFLSNCAPCHGADAEGDDGPSLHGKHLTNTFVAETIRSGFKNEMPPFGHKLKTPEITALVAYVSSLRK